MKENRYGSHTVTRLTAHLIWATKYRYHVLTGDIKVRCRDLLIQICDAEDVRILKGVVSKDTCTSSTRRRSRSRTWSSDLRGARVAGCKKSIRRCARGTGADTSGPSDMARGARATSPKRRCKNILSIIGIHRIRNPIHSSSNESDFQSCGNLCTFSA